MDLSEILNIFSGKPSNGRALYLAWLAFKEKDPKYTKLLRVVPSLAKGAIACIHAAMNEFNVERQQKLLEAASLGKAYYKNRFDGAILGNACAELRVLNAVREKEVGMFLMYQTFARTGKIKGVVERLMGRHMYALALSLAEYSGMKSNEIATSWGVWQVKKGGDKPDQALAAHIAAQLQPYPGLSRAPIVAAALSANRHRLASLILDSEPNLIHRVEGLMKLGETRKALDVAITHLDPDLTLSSTLNIIAANTDKKAMYDMLKDRPFAQQQYAVYCEHRNTAALSELYQELGNFRGQGMSILKASQDPRLVPNTRNLIKSLKEAKEKFLKAGKYSETEVKIMESQVKLLELQEDLLRQGKFKGEGGGVSLRDTLRVLIECGDIKLADTLRKEHGMGDRNYWTMKVTALCESNQYKALETLAAGKGVKKVANKLVSLAPIGFEFFVSECMRCRRPEEAKKYIPKIADYARRAEAYCDIEEYHLAIDCAKEYFDADLLLAIRSRTSDPTIKKRVDDVRAYLVKTPQID
eukprot:TRINITY_DN18657_c2_g1_i2.p1 TRINITY_DN18657_c2_g1~~TRINITY_DN18657_c2_g1_i2.p1  ORF type:complete len:527 (+),score=92.06 TRINITY_DN18657_c2_g1_i2:108-1688(+)